VQDLKIPVRYQDTQANYQADIALLILVTAIEYKIYVRPICLDFDPKVEQRQLSEGNKGKVR
jgi:hypothetical protein